MKRDRIITTIIIALSLAIMGCEKTKPTLGEAKTIHFRSHPDDNIELSIDEQVIAKSAIKIIRKQETILEFSTGTNFSRLIRCGNLAFFSAMDTSDPNGNLRLWEVDFKKGVISPTDITVGGSFSISKDNNWICYEKRMYPIVFSITPRMVAYFPVIYLQNLNSSDKYSFDMKSSFTAMPINAEITNSGNVFVVSYYIDSPIPIREATIDIDQKKITWLDK